MRNALPSSLFAGLLLLATGCSGGSSDGSSSVRIKCIGGQSFCIISCDLGCSQTGCSVTEIAENQRVHFKFSDRVDPASVNSGSISIRTATGVAPDGDFLVVDAEVAFVPRINTINGVSTFGFLRNETYIITLAGGPTAAQGVRSLAGDPLTQEFSCTVRASLGVLDADQLPPSATLVSPTNLQAAPLDPTIVLRFSELIDTTALQTSLGPASPIRIVVRNTFATGECDDSAGVTLGGVPQLSTELVESRPVTVFQYIPAVTLPGRACVTIYITSQVRDLSGRAAVPAQFQFFTEDAVPTPITIVEGFANGAGQDPLVSGGTWNAGGRPGQLGGDGRHGSFDPAITPIPPTNGVYTWNLTPPLPNPPFTIPAGSSLTGLAYPVTDGKFYFTDFVLPAGTTIKFIGTVAPQIYVRGRVLVQGTIDISGDTHPTYVSNTTPSTGQLVSTFNAKLGAPTPQGPLLAGQAAGQPGSFGQCGGGDGGQGGCEAGLLNGAVPSGGINVADGQPGEGVFVAAGHAYAGFAAAAGGRGSQCFPANGVSPSVTTPPNPHIIGASVTYQYRPQFSPGGSGGGFSLAGLLPPVPTIPGVPEPAPGPGPLASSAFPLFPLPAPGFSSLNHFVVGGSGGGGGGSHPYGSRTTLATDIWSAGHGGTGGGGGMAMRAGGDVSVAGGGQLVAKGGAGVRITGDDPNAPVVPLPPQPDVLRGVSSPGGGGSGGSFLVQSGRNVAVSGVIDTRGGDGCFTEFVQIGTNIALEAPSGQLAVIARGGNGSVGFYRLEAANSVTVSTPAAQFPPYSESGATPNTGPLTDRDALSGDRSTWRGTSTILPPTWLYYELDVDTDGDGIVDITYTDNPNAPGAQQANNPAGAVFVRVQGARLDSSGTQPLEGEIEPWRQGVANPTPNTGIAGDGVNGVRFELIYNTDIAPNLVVRAMRVFATT